MALKMLKTRENMGLLLDEIMLNQESITTYEKTKKGTFAKRNSKRLQKELAQIAIIPYHELDTFNSIVSLDGFGFKLFFNSYDDLEKQKGILDAYHNHLLKERKTQNIKYELTITNFLKIKLSYIDEIVKEDANTKFILSRLTDSNIILKKYLKKYERHEYDGVTHPSDIYMKTLQYTNIQFLNFENLAVLDSLCNS